MSYEIHLKNIVMMTLKKILEDAPKIFEEHHMVVEECRGE
jgi:hypothetical protein